MPSNVDYLSEEDVLDCLDWDEIILEMESAFSKQSAKTIIQPPRMLMPIEEKSGILLGMPGYSKDDNFLGFKLVTSFLGNKHLGIPSIFATVMLFDGDTGKPRAIIEGNALTGWRTAAASVAATKHLHKGEKKILAILGAGTQAKTHALAMKHYFKFPQVRIWSRNPGKSIKLCQELGPGFTAFESGESCVRSADVVCTVTYAEQPILMRDWLKDGVHINAVGAGINHHSEIDMATYREAYIFTDHLGSAEKELKGLLDQEIVLKGEVGEIINGMTVLPDSTSITIFHSLGMAIEDILAAKLVYNSYKNKCVTVKRLQ